MQDDNADLRRITREVAARLAARGIHLNGNESPDDISAIEDAVEEFEEVVEQYGGDLMMDEPPPSQPGEPDNPLFLLPVRSAGMSATQYVDSLMRAIDRIKH